MTDNSAKSLQYSIERPDAVTTFVPRYFTRKAILLYVGLLFLCSTVFFGRMLPLHWMTFGLVEVVGFFYFTNLLTRKWRALTPVTYQRRLFRTALVIRVVYVLFSFLFYDLMTGQPFEFEAGDSVGYHQEAIWLISLLKNDQLPIYLVHINGNYSDMGYGVYLTAVYSIFGENILIARLIKALLSTFTCLLIYKLARRNFGDSAGKIAGVLALLSPNLIYYCGLHVKETEMVFLTVFFLERADLLMREKKLIPVVLVSTVLLGLSLFFFRTVLGATAVASLLLGFLLFSERGRKISLVRKVMFGFTVLAIGFLVAGGRIEDEVSKYWGDRETNQEKSMNARANRADGNRLAKYGTTAIFAPIILIAPFPTLVDIETQQNQMMLNGGYYTRNIYAFLLIIGLVALWKQKKLREHLLPISFLFSYLAVLAMSNFALAERFHLPILPVIIIFAAFGATQINRKNIKYYIPYLGLVALIILAWNLFKIMGREG